MPRPARPLPVDLPNVFLSAHARSLGLTAGRLSAHDLDRPFRGVRSRPPDPVEDDDPDAPLARDRAARTAILTKLRAHSLLLPPHAFYIATSALAILGLPFLDAEAAASADIEVGVFSPHRALRRPGIRSVQVGLGRAFVREHEGLRVATPASTWALLGRDLSVPELVVIGDAIVRVPRDDRGRRQPTRQLATIAQLRVAADAGRRYGIARLREALPVIRTGSMSVLETEWRLCVEASDLPDPELDFEVRDAGGKLVGISDAAYPQFRTAVEIEGDHHRVTRVQWDRDIAKYAAYAANDWDVVRCTSRHIRGRRPQAADMVRAVLMRRGWRPQGARASRAT
ncbi:hypothetical protein [Microbacterium invictum]|uniref:AbiEi antitoxin C-terminal domain-containing protein n=1 Tax=Microbacterium invictum TaxID=515415 RepID=A0AA40SS94_9MICO|nr:MULTISPECIES: hypothetical protein [Microbacterium]MBB4141478.1 hypothetical protein [Microbacterium invictum]